MPALVESFSTIGRGWIVNEIIGETEKKKIGPNEIIGIADGFTIDDGHGLKTCSQDSQAAAAHFCLSSENPYISREGEKKSDMYIIAARNSDKLIPLLNIVLQGYLILPPK